MGDESNQPRISEMSDVELVRLLTIEADRYPPEVLEAARAEAARRDLPVDPSFIPENEGAHEASGYEIAGHAVQCPHCRNAEFEEKEVLLNTRGLTFLKLDWLNRSATALICTRCGLVQFFSRRGESGERR